MIYSEVTGRLGADCEVKVSKSDNKYITMRIASNDFYNGEPTTTWIRVFWSGDRAIKMSEHLKKGCLVSVRGVLRTSLYERNGEKAISIEIFADRVDFVSVGSGSTQTTEAVVEEAPKVEPSVSVVPNAEVASATDDDDLPF